MRLLIDGHYLIHRMAHQRALAELTNSDGIKTGAALGVIRAVRDVLMEYNIHQAVLVLDKGYSTRRKKLCPEYKSDRKKSDDDGFDFGAARSMTIELCRLFGVHIIELPGRECDDIVAWISTNTRGVHIILSDDMDMLQLVRERVTVFRPMHAEQVTVNNFEEITGVPHGKFLLYKALVGREMVKGIPGVGKKTAQEILRVPEVVDVQTLVEYAMEQPGKRFETIVDQFDIVDRNLEVMDLYAERFDEHELNLIREDLDNRGKLHDKVEDLVDYLTFLGYSSILDNLPNWLAPFVKLV